MQTERVEVIHFECLLSFVTSGSLNSRHAHVWGRYRRVFGTLIVGSPF